MDKRPLYKEIDGIITPAYFVPEVLREAMAFKPGLDDIIVATYPKCGTTWTMQIVALILRKGRPILTSKEYFSSLPFLEMTTSKELSIVEKPRCMRTHLPFNRINFTSDAKYIYVSRHPADCVVSFFHHTRFFPTYFFTNGSFEDYFELFIKGEVDWNDYFDHLLSWYEHQSETNIMFLTYERMMADPRGACLQIARFLGDDHYNMLVENNEDVLKKVLEYSSLNFMKETVNKFWTEEIRALPSEEYQLQSPVLKKYAHLIKKAADQGYVSHGNFIRNGVVGEGKIKLSKDQLNKLNARICEKMNSDAMNIWK